MPEYLDREEPEESTAESNLRDSFIDKLIRLVQLLIDRLEGSDEDYEYEYGTGWKEKHEKSAEERLQSKEWQEKIETVEQLIEHYSREG